MEEEFRKEDFGIMVNLVEYERFKELEEENKNLKSELLQYKEYNSTLMKEVKLCYNDLYK